MNRVFDYLTGVRHELSLVVWPKKDTIIRLTLIVLLISALVGLYVGALDVILIKLFGFLIIN